MARFTIEFKPNGLGKAQCPPDPNYPHGKSMNMCQTHERGCWVDLPYMAPECGMFIVKCLECKMSVGVTAAGRPDDPTRVKIKCNFNPDAVLVDLNRGSALQ